MDLNKFSHYYSNPLFKKLAKEQKTGFLLGDFNVDLLKYEQHEATNEFLDFLSSNSFPFITRIANQLELLLTQKLSLTYFFTIISLKM